MDLSKNRVVTLLALSRRAFRGYKKKILVLIILGFFGGFLEGIGVNALIPLFSFAIGDGQNGDDVISQTIEKFFGYIRIDFNVTYLLLFVVLMFIAQSFIKVYLDYIRIKISADYELKTRSEIFSQILNSSWPYLSKQKLGHLENIILIDIPRSAVILKEISTGIMLATSLVVYLIVAFNINLVVTLITMVLGLVLFIVIKPLHYRTKILSSELASENKKIAHHTTENILGVKTIKSMVVVSGVVEKGKLFFEKMSDLRIKIQVRKSILGSMTQPVGVIFICLIFLFTYKLPSFSLPALIAIVYLIQRIFSYIQDSQKSINNIVEQLPFLSSVTNYQEIAVGNEEVDAGKNQFVFNTDLVFKNVNFSYTNDAELVLKDLSFTVKKGEMVGIIGPSGVGKTTLVDLILRLLRPQSGTVLLDGQDISTISLKSWREHIGYVSQDMFLINDTIANNIRFYDNSITAAKLEEVSKMANLYEFIQSLPNKFETVIGERGLRLSVGQRQRIVIARILARNPQILVLDEATSALDNESELQIQKVIQGLKGHITVLAIAHRLTTVEDSDKLIVLEKGQVSEQGKPMELLKNKQSYFSKTYNLRK